MPVISVSHLTKNYSIHKKAPGFKGTLQSLFARKYEEVKAVQDISFQLNEGEIVGFIGPNGAGKTTTLKCLSGLLYPTDGDVKVLGYIPYLRDHAYLRQISLIMGQKNQLWWDLPATDTFLLLKEIYAIPNTSYESVLADLTKRLEVEDFLHIPVRKLSLGQRMKMELIASLLHSPKVLFLDEPTIGLDVVMQQAIRKFLKEYNEAYHSTILLTSHYMGDVEALCKRVIIINHGQILYDGLLTELIKERAPYKIIKVIFAKKVEKKELDSFKGTVNFDFPQWEVRAEQEDANNLASEILKKLPVEDITIEDPSIEDVISRFFKANKKSARHE